MQATINQLRRIRTLQEDPEASTNGQVLEALLDVADSFPEIIAALCTVTDAAVSVPSDTRTPKKPIAPPTCEAAAM